MTTRTYTLILLVTVAAGSICFWFAWRNGKLSYSRATEPREQLTNRPRSRSPREGRRHRPDAGPVATPGQFAEQLYADTGSRWPTPR